MFSQESGEPRSDTYIQLVCYPPAGFAGRSGNDLSGMSCREPTEAFRTLVYLSQPLPDNLDFLFTCY